MISWIVSSTVLIVLIMCIRFAFRNKIKLWLRYALWFVVLVRLLIPFSLFDSRLSIMNVTSKVSNIVDQQNTNDKKTSTTINKEEIADTESIYLKEGTSDSNDILTGTQLTANTGSTKVDTYKVLMIIWISGIVVVASFFIISNLLVIKKLHKVRHLYKVEKKLPVYTASIIQSPCLYGVFRPAIYITPEVEKDDNILKYVLAHEVMHYKHGDNLWSLLRSICLTLHWYNPFVWVAGILSKKDAELACDEGTIKRLDDEERFVYGQVLIDLSTGKRSSKEFLYYATTMTSNKKLIKERVQLIAKKPKTLIGAFVVIMSLIAVAISVTFSGQKTSGNIISEEIPEITSREGKNDLTIEKSKSTEPKDNSQEDQNQEEGYSVDKLIVGSAITPSTDLVKVLNGDIEDCTEDKFSGFVNEALKNIESQDDAFLEDYYLIGQTESFKIYGKGNLNSFIIQTKKGNCIAVDSPYTSNYAASPIFEEADYDRDGEKELSIMTYFLHGTGVSIETLYMADKLSDGMWNVYQFRSSDYLNMLGEHYSTIEDEQGIQLSIDNISAGRRINTKQYHYEAGNWIFFVHTDEKIQIRAVLAADSNEEKQGITYIYSDDGIEADVQYLGDGKWNIANAAYHNFEIESIMEAAIEYYFQNNSEELNNIYAAKGSTLEAYGEVLKEPLKIISISYDPQTMNEDVVIASACIRIGNNDSYDYLTSELVYEIPEGSLVGNWKITSVYNEK